MRLLKNSSASIIAILAVFTTIAAQAGAFEAKRFPIQNCFIPIFTIDYSISCIDNWWFSAFESCSSSFVTQAEMFNGHIFGGLNDFSKIFDWDVATQCPGAPNIICCIFVEEDYDPCWGQPYFSLNGLPFAPYRIESIICKTY